MLYSSPCDPSPSSVGKLANARHPTSNSEPVCQDCQVHLDPRQRLQLGWFQILRFVLSLVASFAPSSFLLCETNPKAINPAQLAQFADEERKLLERCNALEDQLQQRSKQLQSIERLLSLYVPALFEGKPEASMDRTKFEEEMQRFKIELEISQPDASAEIEALQKKWGSLKSFGSESSESQGLERSMTASMRSLRFSPYFYGFCRTARKVLEKFELELKDEKIPRDGAEKRTLLQDLNDLHQAWEAEASRAASRADPEFLAYTEYTLDHLQQLQRLQEAQLERIRIQRDRAKALKVELEIAQRLDQVPASESMGLSLRSKLRELPHPAPSAKVKKQIEEHTQNIFESNEKRRLNAGKTLAFIRSHQPLAELEASRSDNRDRYSLYLNDLEEENRGLARVIESCEKLVQDYCLWLQDSAPLDLKALGKSFREFKSIWGSGLDKAKLTFAVLMITLTMLFYGCFLFFWRHFYLKYKQKLKELERSFDSIHKDRFAITLFRVAFQALASSALPGLLCALSLSARLTPYEGGSSIFAQAFASACLKTAPISWLLNFIYCCAKPHALFQKHFKVSPIFLGTLFRGWTLESLLFQYAWFGFHCFGYENLEQYSPTLVRVHFILIGLSSALMAIQTLRAGTPIFALDQQGRSTTPLNSFLTLAFLSTILYSGYMAWKGFFETAKVILESLGKLVLVWFALMMVYQLVVRLMLLQRRRMAFEINLQQRSELLAQRLKQQGGDSNEEVESELCRVELDLKKVSSQTLNLIRSLTQLAGLVGLLMICSKIQPIFKILALPIPFSNEINTLTLLTTSFAGYMLYLLYVNLPALLDLFILPHLNITADSRYTLKYLTKLVALSLSCCLLLKLLEIDQRSIQILGAGLSATVAFGMRDFLNSLTAGAIILTTKRLSIGDTVEFRGAAGVVTQITMLNVILVNADKKEISIPSKDLLYETFARWPSDELVHRLVLKVMVPSHCPADSVLKALQQSAEAVMGLTLDPEGGTLIEEITPGYLHYQLRALASDLPNQNQIRTKLYEKIITEIEGLGIQRDLVTIK